MSREELLAWAGLIVGIPGFLLFFFTGQITAGVLTVLIFGSLIYLRWHLELPEFTLIEVQKTLRFEDPEGHRAKLTRMQIAQANHKGLTEFWVRNLTSDGRIENILVDGKKPDKMREEAGAKQVCQQFKRALKRGQQNTMNLTYDLIDSFHNEQALIHNVSYKTKKLRLRVEFHPQKPSTNSLACLLYGGQEHKALPQPKTLENGRIIELEVKRPKLGAEYKLEWEW